MIPIHSKHPFGGMNLPWLRINKVPQETLASCDKLLDNQNFVDSSNSRRVSSVPDEAVVSRNENLPVHCSNGWPNIYGDGHCDAALIDSQYWITWQTYLDSRSPRTPSRKTRSSRSHVPTLGHQYEPSDPLGPMRPLLCKSREYHPHHNINVAIEIEKYCTLRNRKHGAVASTSSKGH